MSPESCQQLLEFLFENKFNPLTRSQWVPKELYDNHFNQLNKTDFENLLDVLFDRGHIESTGGKRLYVIAAPMAFFIISPKGVSFFFDGGYIAENRQKELDQEKRSEEYTFLCKQNEFIEVSRLLAEKQFELADNQIATNKNVNDTNKAITRIYLLTFGAALASVFMSGFNIYREIHKDTLTQQIQQLQSLLHKKNKAIYQVKKP